MKYLKAYLLICLIAVSCTSKKQETAILVPTVEIKIPSIKKNKGDAKFKLTNGVLFFDKIPFSGTVNDFYIDGKLKSTSEYYLGKRHHKYFGFYRNGNKWFERFYVNGLKSDEHKGWFENGQQMFHYQFNNKGLYDGFVKDWHLNGTQAKHFNFMKGKESGPQKMWFLNGKIRANFHTINGERHGLIGLKKCISVLSKKNIND